MNPTAKTSPVPALVLALALAVCLLLAGCQPSSEGSAPENASGPKQSVTLTVEFSSNLLFDRYDVEVLVDGVSQGVLSHGKGAVFQLELAEGDHAFLARSSEDQTVKGEATFNVPGDSKPGFRIDCGSSEIYVERLETVACPIGSGEVKGRTSDNLEQLFKDAGFTNVSFEELRDLAEEEEHDIKSVERVTIAGSEQFSNGEAFYPGDEVVISYHLPADISAPASAADMVGQNYEEVVRQLEEAGFFPVEATPASSRETGIPDNGAVEVVIDTFPSVNDFKAGQTFPYDTGATVYYNEAAAPEDTDPNGWDAEWDARRTFERFGEVLYPYGFECHWALDMITCEPQGDGTFFIKVGVTITNEYGAERRTYAQGIAGNGNVEDFYVS